MDTRELRGDVTERNASDPSSLNPVPLRMAANLALALTEWMRLSCHGVSASC
jgi:hypothetical protein